jgi:hypothetical protein
MSESLAVGHAQTRPAGRAGDTAGIAALDARRKLQLALGVIWLLNGILQFQPSMFAARLTEELDADAVTEGLARSVHTALEPAHLSIWLSEYR